MFCKQRNEPLCTEEPACFRDLNLDQLVNPIIEKEQEIDLSALYDTPLQDLEDIQYRQSVFRELLDERTGKIWDRFSLEICSLAKYLEKAQEDLHSGDRWKCNYLLYGHFLDYGERYCGAIARLRQELAGAQHPSEGLRKTVQSIEALCDSDFYICLKQALVSLRDQFDRTQYCMLIKNGTIRVKKYESEENLSEKITDVFQKFQQKDGKSYLQNFTDLPHADHVEAGVLQCLSHIYPALFQELEHDVRAFSDFLDGGLLNICREMRFYMSWLHKIEELRECGLPVCFPQFGTEELFANGFYDLLLAEKIGSDIVQNDFYMKSPERILVVTGPNQGGKTTFARAIGQIHYLASLGLCVPGTSAQLLLPDQVLTHFERGEALVSRNGKLADDLLRLHQVFQLATERSVIIINEIFASTVLEDAVCLGKRMMEQLIATGCCCVLVTFLDALAECGPETVSMVSTVDPDAPDRRTYQICRRPPDGQAYALTLAAKHGLTYDQIVRRILS